MTMLKLLSAFHTMALYTRAMNLEVETSSVDEDFHCNSLTSRRPVHHFRSLKPAYTYRICTI